MDRIAYTLYTDEMRNAKKKRNKKSGKTERQSTSIQLHENGCGMCAVWSPSHVLVWPDTGDPSLVCVCAQFSLKFNKISKWIRRSSPSMRKNLKFGYQIMLRSSAFTIYYYFYWYMLLPGWPKVSTNKKKINTENCRSYALLSGSNHYCTVCTVWKH